MVGGLCPQAENVAECEEQLPNFWESIAVVLWPAYYSPEVHILTIFSRRGFATPLCRELVPGGEDSSQAFQNFEDDISSVPFKVLFNMK